MPTLQLLPPASILSTPEACAPVLEYLMHRGGMIAIDTETTGLRRMRDYILFWSMGTEDQRWCFPASMLHRFSLLFSRPDIRWCLANAKYDMHMLANAGVQLAGEVEDILVMSAMVDVNQRHGLKEQAQAAYGVSWGDFKDLFLKGESVRAALKLNDSAYERFMELDTTGDKLLFVHAQAPQVVAEYASCDAFFTYKRWEDLTRELMLMTLPIEGPAGFSTLYDYFQVIEVPYTKVLWRAERKGVLIDMDYIKKIEGPMKEGLAEAKMEIASIIGDESFNPGSPAQLSQLLYARDGWDLKPSRVTAAMKPSTDKKALEALAARHAGTDISRFIMRVLDYRKLQKIFGTYVKDMEKHLCGKGRLHTQYNQAVARTARLSSSDPNLQNIPRPDNDIFALRSAFIAEDGYKLSDKDYPQIEFRVAGVNANEQALLTAIRKGWDIHTANAVNIFHVEYEDINQAKAKNKEDLTEEDQVLLHYRQDAKTLGLAVLFGVGLGKMAATLGVTKDRAKVLKGMMSDAYPALAAHVTEMHMYAAEFGYTYTMLGRMRPLPQFDNDYRPGLVAQAERQAYNTNVQGSAAELLKLAMLRIDADPRLKDMGAEIVLSVHDELVLEAPSETVVAVSKIQEELMADPLHWGPIDLTYPVPITPDGSIGDRWSECH